MIIIIAPAERYTPPPTLLSRCLIVSTSIRKFFFSAEFRVDLSIMFISFNLLSKALASIASAGFETDVEDDAAFAAAFDWSGWNVKAMHVTIIQKTIFFILFDLSVIIYLE